VGCAAAARGRARAEAETKRAARRAAEQTARLAEAEGDLEAQRVIASVLEEARPPSFLLHGNHRPRFMRLRGAARSLPLTMLRKGRRLYFQ